MKEYFKNVNRAWSSLVVMLSLAGVSCSDDFKSPVAPTETTTINAKVTANTDLNILEALLAKSGLDKNLGNANSGTYTLFAPTDDAFLTFFQSASIYNKTLTEQQALDTIKYMTNSAPSANWNLAVLVSRLNYHLIGSKVTSSDIGGGKTFITFNGARLSLSNQNSDVLLNANSGSTGAKVVTADTQALNGVFHTIDKVMAIPSTSTTVLTPFGMSVSYGATTTVSGGTDTGADSNGADFDLFAFAIRTGNIAPTLIPNSSPLPDFTIFAPTDDAMLAYLGAATEADAITAIKAMTTDDVANLVKYHIASGRLLSTDLSDGLVVTTLLTSKTIKVALNGATITLGDGNLAADPVVTSPNGTYNDGVVHTINGVLQAN
ncbi:MAG TPA: fasciclin domain-containing protein [Cyclobacteriaceae bacterium]